MSINEQLENEPETEPLETSFEPEPENENMDSLDYPNEYSYNEPLHNRKSKKSPLILVLCLIISLFGGIIGGSLYGYISSTKSSEKTLSSGNSDNTSAQINSSTMLSSAEVVKLVADSVVDVSTETTTKSSDNKSYVSISAGSGIVYSSDGYIVTNEHIIKDTNKIIVTLKNGTKYSATLIGSDSNKDIALLKINASGLSTVTFGNSDNLEVGESTIVIGNPLGELSGTVTEGVVSAINREVTVEGHEMSLLQTSAEINSGNSGGGVFRLTGELIGMVIAKSSGDDIEGLGFAIPANTVKTVVESLKK
ncbi:MAG: hypothetical protein RUMPE_01033 [Eubacteriales bacterium SKADARSKE-1]|nr:hypothetical protein [Eubacteriales bacterium SKADARSKE-1]